jgi:tyrosyl-tRNA synthetase
MLERGFLHQCTDFTMLDDSMIKTRTVAYLGFDATAKSLHVGSLLQIMILRHLQKCGHKPIVLIGGGTTKVGDPTGKDESRQLLSPEIIEDNIQNLSTVFKRFLNFGDGPTDAVMVNNAEWLDSLNYLNFLRDYGRLFTINRLLSFDSVKQRLAREQPFSFLEFNYILLQSYDFVELSKRYHVSLQLGGSDQWGNIVSGIELGRKLNVGPLFGLTAPLITTSDGKKMGKTATGAVWLNRDLLSEFDYWQFWRNTADADVIRFLKLFTEIPMEQIEEFEKLEGADLNKVKILLADEATKLLHGDKCLADIHSTVSSLFGRKSGDELESLPKVELLDAAFTQESGTAIPVCDALVIGDLAASKNEARRLIKAGGVKVNDSKVTDEYALVRKEDFGQSGRLKLSASKKKHALILYRLP